MKIIAFYLPQFHRIPENDKWWGEDFTEWVNVRNAQPMFTDHYQPRIPYNHNYYNLLDDKVKEWQIDLAKSYGIYGFCFYHYWFDGKMLLEKPVNQFLENKALDIHFCLSWANEHWTNAWTSKKQNILIAQQYGDRDQWVAHFQYFLPFFKDNRYIRIDDKPLLILYRPNLISCLGPMLECWDNMAREAGLPGLTYAYQAYCEGFENTELYQKFQFKIEYQPVYERIEAFKSRNKLIDHTKKSISKFLDRYFKINVQGLRLGGVAKFDYDVFWNRILARMPADAKCVPGAFVDWDNTSRRKERGSVAIGACPEKFKEYLKRQIIHAREDYKKDMLFMFAWNEWAEAGYLEPDMKYEFQYLEAIKEALIETNEWIVG